MSFSRSIQAGFTLIELMVVMAIIAIGLGAVVLSLRTGDGERLLQEGERLAALLDVARAQSRSSGVPLVFATRRDTDGAAGGFEIRPQRSVLERATASPPQTDAQMSTTRTWMVQGLAAAITVGAGQVPAQSALLGPEPMLAPTRITLSAGAQQVAVFTNGVRPFSVERLASQSPP